MLSQDSFVHECSNYHGYYWYLVDLTPSPISVGFPMMDVEPLAYLADSLLRSTIFCQIFIKSVTNEKLISLFFWFSKFSVFRRNVYPFRLQHEHCGFLIYFSLLHKKKNTQQFFTSMMYFGFIKSYLNSFPRHYHDQIQLAE